MKIPRSQEQKYFSDVVTSIRRRRTEDDPRKRDLSPTRIERPGVSFLLARHFGFCFGVDNAVEVAYRALAENPNKRIFLVSEMIHNPSVNADLVGRGIQFLRTSDGKEIVPTSQLQKGDVVIVPAFGAPLAVMEELSSAGIEVTAYDATCPFVEKVWRRAAQLGKDGYSLVVHGKGYHEETRATFSRVQQCAPGGVVVKTLEEVDRLCLYIKGEGSREGFYREFEDKITPEFDPEVHLRRLGVINQTTMLAEETKEVGRRVRLALIERFGADSIQEHFADTRDTLCYATSENQSAARALLSDSISSASDLAIVVGGFNSSNTANLATLLRKKFDTYHIRGAQDIGQDGVVSHLAPHAQVVQTADWLPSSRPVRIALTAGASTPDAEIEGVMCRIEELLRQETSGTRDNVDVHRGN
jgi:4-hydroxy-3-methylbut-2-enyl diphosphate reductase